MGEDRRSSAPETADGGSGAEGKTCERCGNAIETSEWYPIAAERNAEGSLELYPFCSEDCQMAWREERPT